MSTDMQQEDKSLNIHTVRRRPEGQSVVEQRFRDIVSFGQDADVDLMRYADVWHEEEIRRAKAIYPSDLWCFGVSVEMGGLWAAEVLPFVPAKYPKTRKMMARIIVDGWLGCRDLDAEVTFAQVLRQWPHDEGKLVGDAIREILEFRGSDDHSQKIGRFFGLRPGTAGNSEVVTTMLKAAVKCSSIDKLVEMGEFFFVLADERFSLHDQCRRKIVLGTLHKQIELAE